MKHNKLHDELPSVGIDELVSNDELALHLADTIKRGCEDACLLVEILPPSVNGYAMSIHTPKWSCEVFVKPAGHIRILN